LVVADLSEHNANVLYELAVRHVARKPVIQITKTGEPLPFDVASTRTIELDHHDLESAAACRKSLVRQIKNAEKNPKDFDNPISAATDLQLLRESGSLIEKSNARIISMLSDLKSSVDEALSSRTTRRLETTPHTQKFRMTLPQTIYDELDGIAKERGLSVDELITSVIMPEWVSSGESDFPLLMEKSRVDNQLGSMKGYGERHVFSVSLSDGAAGEPGFVLVSDPRNGGQTFFDVYLKGGFVSGTAEEILGTLEQVAKGIGTKLNDVKTWTSNPSTDKSELSR
jgi:hypothetical protein